MGCGCGGSTPKAVRQPARPGEQRRDAVVQPGLSDRLMARGPSPDHSWEGTVRPQNGPERAPERAVAADTAAKKPRASKSKIA